MRVYRDIPFSIRALCVVIGPIMHMSCFCVWQRTAVFFCMAYFARFLFVASYGRTAAFMGIPLLVQLFNRLPFSAVFPLFHALWRLIAGAFLHSGNPVSAQVLSIAFAHTPSHARICIRVCIYAPASYLAFETAKNFLKFLNIHLCVCELPLFMRLRAASIFYFWKNSYYTKYAFCLIYCIYSVYAACFAGFMHFHSHVFPSICRLNSSISLILKLRHFYIYARSSYLHFSTCKFYFRFTVKPFYYNVYSFKFYACIFSLRWAFRLQRS